MKYAPATALLLAMISLASLAPVASGQQKHQLQIDTPGQLTRLELTLPDAIDGRDVTLHFGIQDGRVRQAWGFASGSTRVIDAIDAGKLSWDGRKLSGSLVCWVDLDGESQTRRLEAELQATLSDGRCSGSYSAKHSVLTETLTYETDSYVLEPGEFSLFHYGQQFQGKARARLTGLVRPQAASLRIWTRHALRGDASWQRYVTLEVEIAQGKAAGVKIVPSNGARAGWVAAVQNQQLRLAEGKLEGSVTFKVSTPDTAGIEAGLYRFDIAARVVDNTLRGSTSVSLNGKPIAGQVGLAGVGQSPLEERKATGVRVIELARGIEAQRDLRIHLVYQGRQLKGAVAFHPTFPEWWNVSMPDGPESLRVSFPESSYMTSKTDAVDVDYQLSLDQAGKGTFRCRFGDYVKSGGRVSGRLLSEADLRRRNAIAQGHGWPFWNGPTSSFAAKPSPQELVESLDKARLVWIGQDIPPARCQTTRYGEGNLVRFLQRGGCAGGGASPVLADGKVYLYYFQPSGSSVGDYVQDMARSQRHVLRKMWLTEADDVVLCMDAATGKTLWKTTFPGQGRYYGSHGTGRAKGAYTSNLAVAEGKAVIHTTGGWTHCLDADSGKRLWSSRKGGGALRVIAADVVVASGEDVVAFDLADGRELDLVAAYPLTPTVQALAKLALYEGDVLADRERFILQVQADF